MPMPKGILVTVQLPPEWARALIDAVDLTKEKPDSDLTKATLRVMDMLHHTEAIWETYEVRS